MRHCRCGSEPAVQPRSLNSLVQRTVGRQRHRCNVPHSSPEEYYRRAICVPLLDHIIEHMATRFGPMQQKAAGLCCLVPSVVVSGRSVGFKLLGRVDDLTKQWEADLPCRVVNVERTRWVSKWRGLLEPPDSLQAALQACDEGSSPNVKALLRLSHQSRPNEATVL